MLRFSALSHSGTIKYINVFLIQVITAATCLIISTTVDPFLKEDMKMRKKDEKKKKKKKCTCRA